MEGWRKLAGTAEKSSELPMSRWVGFFVCAIFGLAMLFCGLQVPVHLRAVDAIVLQKAGAGTRSLIDRGLSLIKNDQLGAAQLFLAAAQNAGIADSDKLDEAVDDLATRQPTLRIHGRAEKGRLDALLQSNQAVTHADLHMETFTPFVVRSANRAKALELLQSSPSPLVQALLHFRSFTNTVLFPPSFSTSGQALDAAVSICGLLTEGGHLSVGLSNAVLVLATDANRAGHSQPLERVLLDMMSLGQRFNWGQLATFVEQIQEAETLGVLSEVVRRGAGVPVLYSAVCLTGNAAGVARYLTNFRETGLQDLRWSLGCGAGGVTELLQQNQRLCNSRICERVAALGSSVRILNSVLDYSRREPLRALSGKWLLYLLGGFLLAAAFHVARRVPALEKPLEVRGFHLAREFLFALGFLLVVLLLSEPFLSQGNQKVEFPFRLQLPTVGGVAPVGSTVAHKTSMNQVTTSLLTLLLFFVLQGLIYIACLVKLAEIRRQRVPLRTKLKLLENEDHLFDAGLYLGFVGTIISLILVSLTVIQFSLMAAYSSTCFGIVFVVAFKIFHLRPMRRKLLLEADAEAPETSTPAAHAYAAPV
jgi:formate/nitrite transporter FocA (FNT family)